MIEDWLIITIAAGISLLPLHTDLMSAIIIWPVSWLVIGTRMRGLATLVHEVSHNTLTKNKHLGMVIGTVFSAWPILQLETRYRVSHMDHHRHLGDEVRDPDTEQYVLQGLPDENPRTFIWKHLILLLLGVKTLPQLPYLLRHRLIPTPGLSLFHKQHVELAGFLAFWFGVTILVTVNHWWLEFLVIWIIPYLTVFQAVGWLIETAEHFPLVWLEKAHLEMTRNRKGSAIERFFFGIHAEWLHRVHHERPGIPFWLLKKAHEVLMKDPEYARSEALTGGLLTKGKNGEPSIISQLPALLRKAQA